MNTTQKIPNLPAIPRLAGINCRQVTEILLITGEHGRIKATKWKMID
jgi:hypothetical protein